MSFKARINLPRKQGGWVAVPYIIAGLAAGGAAYQQINQGKATSNNAKFQARIEGDAAKQQEIQRRQDLLRALSSQNANAAAGGIQTSSLAAGLKRQINQNSNDLLTINANASARQSLLASQASNARAAGNVGAAVSLLDSAGRAYKGAG